MTVNPSDLVDIEKVKLGRYEPFVTLNSRGELYFNPYAMFMLDETVPIPTESVGYQVLSSTEIAIHFLVPGDNTVPFKRPPNKRTGRCSFRPILDMKPYLKVAKGRLNLFPFRLDKTEGGQPIFTLVIDSPKVASTRSSGRRSAGGQKAADQKQTPTTNQAPGQMSDDQGAGI